jgi:hypothetical protein
MTISGTPAAATGGAYTITVTARNSTGSAISQTYSFSVIQPTPGITTSAVATFVMGQNNIFTVKSTGLSATGAPATLSVLAKTGTQTGLPAGVTLVDNGNGTATLKGVPQAGTKGVYTFTIQAAVPGGKSFNQAFSLTVDAAPVIVSADNHPFASGGGLQTFIVSTTSTGAFGFPTPVLSATLISGGAMPTWLTFKDNHNGTGTFTATPPGIAKNTTFTFMIAASSGTLPKSFQLFTLTIS